MNDYDAWFKNLTGNQPHGWPPAIKVLKRLANTDQAMTENAMHHNLDQYT